MPLPLRTRWVAAAWVLVAGACGGSDEPDLPESAELGVGENRFEALAQGASLEVIQGPQGGFHLIGSVRITGIEPGDPDDLRDPDNPTTSFRVFQGDTRVDANASNYTQGLDAVGDGVYEMVGRFLILDIQDESEIAGQMLRMTVEVQDRSGRMARDERMVLAVDESP